MVDQTNAFTSSPDENNLIALRSRFLEAYGAWQYVSMFDIGKAEEIGLRNYTNIFPTDIDAIEANIASGTYNLTFTIQF